jgi:molybdenum cofactor guanylyltransferase
VTAAAGVADFDTVILAGGRASRLAGADKPGLAVAGVPMLASVAVAAVAAGTRQLIIVGPVRRGLVADALARATAGLRGGVTTVREEPPGGGPVPALRRGLAEVTAPWLALLAADLPFLTGDQLAELLADACPASGGPGGSGEPGGSGGPGGTVLTDGDGRPQWLAGVWRADRLRAAMAGYQGSSLHGLLAPLAPLLVHPEVTGGPPPWLDCDTPDDLAAARALTGDLAGQNGEP